MKFAYFEIRPCIEFTEPDGDSYVDSYIRKEDYLSALETARTNGTPIITFWTVYGRYDDGDGAFLAEAIADRETEAQAVELLNAILAPVRKTIEELSAILHKSIP